MTTNGDKNRYLTMKSIPTDGRYHGPIRSLSRFCRRKTSNHSGDLTAWIA